MLFLTIFTFDAANREAIVKRRALEKDTIPRGVQVHMEVVDLSKNRVFRIFEVTDPKAILESNMAWSDLAEVETIPVMEIYEMMEVIERIERREQLGKELSDSLELASLM